MFQLHVNSRVIKHYLEEPSVIHPSRMVSSSVSHMFPTLAPPHSPMEHISQLCVQLPSLTIQRLQPARSSTHRVHRARPRGQDGRFISKDHNISVVEEHDHKVCGWCGTSSTSQWRVGPPDASVGKFISSHWDCALLILFLTDRCTYLYCLQRWGRFVTHVE